MANVAFLGTGMMGSGMVEAMLRRGEAVAVWNRTESKARALEPLGAKVAASPADAVTAADRVHLAAAYKLFGNSMLFVLTGGIADVFAMAKANGIEPADALTVFDKFPVGNFIKLRGEKMARRDFSATFELTMARKDTRLMLEAADGQPLTVLPGIAKRMDDAIASGHGKDDLGAIAAEVLR